MPFDVGNESLVCIRALKERFSGGDPDLRMMRGSVLDLPFLESLSKVDIPYSCGVLYHTGDMWRAIENITTLAKPEARFLVAIYNDQGRGSRH